MKRIDETFQKLQKKGEKALITYITAGDPDLKTTEALLYSLAEQGADIIELGVPFSDPMADGITIQHAFERALQNPFSMDLIFNLVRTVRKKISTPIILFGYYNPFYQYGLKKLCTDARDAGVDGLLIVDLPPEEAQSLKTEALACGLDLVFLLAPTSTEERIKQVASLGTECVRKLKNVAPDVPVLMLTVYDDSEQIFKSLQAGATGYLLKRTPKDKLLDAIRENTEGGAPMSRQIALRVVRYFSDANQLAATPQRAPEIATLTTREEQVLALLAKGHAYKEIADLLQISFETVRSYVRTIYDKLHVHSRTEATLKYLGR